MQNQLRTVNAATGATTVRNSFVFSGGAWNPGTFVSDASGNVYAQSFDRTVYTFNALTGQVVHDVMGDTSMGQLRLSSSGQLIGIGYDPGSMRNEVRVMNPITGATTLLNSFTFTSGAYRPFTVSIDLTGNRLYAMASDAALHAFDLTTGASLPTVPADTTMDTLASDGAGGLIGISYNDALTQFEIRTLNALTGATAVLNTFEFDSGGYRPSSFLVDPALNPILVT